MRVHIKFLEHGKGSPSKASSYLLDALDHLGNVRAGIDVLKGDATTFNAICDASPHLWKYTSGVIAWSKDDAPTDEQIREVLNDFEQHAFSGLDPSQYHLFAVQHTDDDGSKHIHVLVPRLDLHSGKSLNIAPPGHEKHFDSLRDYFNTKYQWSRPDDVLLMQTTQEPNHIAKLNKQAKNILTSQELETLPKKQFCKAIDNLIKTLLKTQDVKTRADIVNTLEKTKGVDSVKQSKEFLTVILKNGKKHRLKGDFYHEQFEIGSYSEHLRAAAESRPTANELAAALTDADQLRATYRAKREAYNQQHYPVSPSPTNDNSARIASKLDSVRNWESITRSDKNAHSELYSANRSTPSKIIEYRYCENIRSEIEHRFVFNIVARLTKPNQQPSTAHFNRPTESTEEYPKPSTTSDSQSKRTDREQSTDLDHGKTEYAKNDTHAVGSDGLWSADSFNQFISGLSSQYKSQNDRSSTTSYSTEQRSDRKPSRLFGSPKEINYANRDRPIFERAKQLIESTKQLVIRAKRSIESTSEFIKKHFDHLQRARAELKQYDQTSEHRERNTAGVNFSDESRTFKNRASQLFRRVTASISQQLEDPITNSIDDSLESTGFKQRYQQFGENRVKTSSNEDGYAANRSRESTLENLAIESTEQLLRRFADARQADEYAWRNCRKIDSVNQQLERLENTIAEIRIKPKSAMDFSRLRYDGYYPDYTHRHEKLSEQQQQAYKNKSSLQVIDCINQKMENIKDYVRRAGKEVSSWQYDNFEKMIKNDQRMLKYLQCEQILEPQNDHLKQHRSSYQECFNSFESIKSYIQEIRNPSVKQTTVQQNYEPEHKPKSDHDLDLGF